MLVHATDKVYFTLDITSVPQSSSYSYFPIKLQKTIYKPSFPTLFFFFLKNHIPDFFLFRIILLLFHDLVSQAPEVFFSLLLQHC